MSSFQGRWLPDSNDFRDACLQIAMNMKDFKRHPVYSGFVGNDMRSFPVARQFYLHIQKEYPELFRALHRFTANDSVGSPNLYPFEGLQISPGTLRFVSVLGAILPLSPRSIVEIGGGYGGQCLVTKIWWPETRYTIVDLPESLAVSRAYLGPKLAQLLPCNDFEAPASDLVLSDYCITELDEAGVDFYFDAVISRSQAGYFTGQRCPAFDRLLERLQDQFDVDTAPEEPKTTHHENFVIRATRASR